MILQSGMATMSATIFKNYISCSVIYDVTSKMRYLDLPHQTISSLSRIKPSGHALANESIAIFSRTSLRMELGAPNGAWVPGWFNYLRQLKVSNVFKFSRQTRIYSIRLLSSHENVVLLFYSFFD